MYEDRLPASPDADTPGAPPPSPPPRPAASHLQEVAAWAALALVVVGIFVLTLLVPASEAAAGPAGRVEFQFQGRYAVGVHAIVGKLGERLAGDLTSQLLEQMSAQASTPAERLCAVPVLAEIAGTERAVAEIAGLRQTPDLPADVVEDLELLDRIYDGTSGDLTDEERSRFLERREWFARLALSQGTDPDDPAHGADRRALLGDSIRVAAVMMGLFMGVVAAGVAGLALLVLGFVLHGQKRLRALYSPRRATVEASRRLPFLETVVVFLVFMLGASAIGGLVFELTDNQPLALLTTLLSAAAVLWPLVRGAGSEDLRRAYGWHRGQGFWREIGWGLVGYVAGAPLLILGILMSLGLTKLVEEPPRHPLMDGLTESGPGGILAIFVLACVSAPLVEETVFRGGFYHYLRGRFGVMASALVVSVVFAVIHPQGILGVPPLIALAMILALIREWRGSLVASVAVHAVHNGIATTVLLIMLS